MPVKRPLVSDDEYSDDDFVDELSEDDADVKPGDVFGKILKGSLNAPTYTTFSTRAIHEMLHAGQVDLEAAYQRDVVWPESKMIMLIQSLFLNYYIPPVIFAVTLTDDGDENRLCIDGKQRCSSLLAFMDGKIPFLSPGTKERFWYRKFHNQRGKELPPALRRRFEAIQIQAVDYRGISDEQQRDIFQRVQMGVSLSAAEKLQAIPGPWTIWILQLLKKYVTEENSLGERIDWDVKRGRPFQNLTAFIMLAYDPSRKSLPSSSQMHIFLERTDPPDTHFRRKIEMALGLMLHIATDFYEAAFKSMPQKIAPIEFSFAALIIFTRMGVLSVASLAAWIGKLRVHIRKEKGHIDVRSNSRVAADFARFVDNLPKVQPHGETPAAEEFANDDVDPRDIRAHKRARRAEDEDPSYRGPIIPRDIAAENRRKANGNAQQSRVSGPSRAALPPVPAARPPPSSMDRAAPNGHGSYPQEAYRQPAPASQPQYSAAQIAHFTAIQNAQQSSQHAKRWT